MSEYYKKYLKYKNKYVNLQKQIGGESFEHFLNSINTFMHIITPLNNSYIGFTDIFRQPHYKKLFVDTCNFYRKSHEDDKIKFVKWLNNKYTEKNEIDILRKNPIFFLFYIKIIAYIIDKEPTNVIKEHIKIIIDNSRQLITTLKSEPSYNKFNKEIFDEATENLNQLKL